MTVLNNYNYHIKRDGDYFTEYAKDNEKLSFLKELTQTSTLEGLNSLESSYKAEVSFTKKRIWQIKNPYTSSLESAPKVAKFAAYLFGFPLLIAYILDAIYSPSDKEAIDTRVEELTTREKDKRLSQFFKDVERDLKIYSKEGESHLREIAENAVSTKGLDNDALKELRNKYLQKIVIPTFYSSVLKTFGNDEIKTLEFMDFLHQGILASVTKTISKDFNGFDEDENGDLLVPKESKSEEILVATPHESADLTFNCDLEKKSISVKNNFAVADGVLTKYASVFSTQEINYPNSYNLTLKLKMKEKPENPKGIDQLKEMKIISTEYDLNKIKEKLLNHLAENNDWQSAKNE